MIGGRAGVLQQQFGLQKVLYFWINFVVMPNAHCPNCEQAIVEQNTYCAHCGQKLHLPRPTIGQFLYTTWQVLTNLERGFLHTFKELILRPGKTLQRVWQGATRDYYHPLRFAFITITLSVAVSLLLGMGDYVAEFNQQVEASRGASEEAVEFQRKINEMVMKYVNFLSLIIIPFVALVARWMYAKQKPNFAEHLIASAYFMGAISLVSIIPTVAILELFPKGPKGFALLMVGSSIYSIVYFSYAYYQLFRQNLLLTILKSIIMLVLGYALFILFSMVIGIVVGIGIALLS